VEVTNKTGEKKEKRKKRERERGERGERERKISTHTHARARAREIRIHSVTRLLLPSGGAKQVGCRTSSTAAHVCAGESAVRTGASNGAR